MLFNNLFTSAKAALEKVIPTKTLSFKGAHMPDSILDSFTTTFFSILGLGIPSKPRNGSGRILVLSICLTGAVVFWSYSAGLVSFLTVEKYEFPIKSLKVSGSCLSQFVIIPVVKKAFLFRNVDK